MWTRMVLRQLKSTAAPAMVVMLSVARKVEMKTATLVPPEKKRHRNAAMPSGKPRRSATLNTVVSMTLLLPDARTLGRLGKDNEKLLQRAVAGNGQGAMTLLSI